MLRLSVGVNVNNLYILPYLASLPLYYFFFLMEMEIFLCVHSLPCYAVGVSQVSMLNRQ